MVPVDSRTTKQSSSTRRQSGKKVCYFTCEATKEIKKPMTDAFPIDLPGRLESRQSMENK